MENKYRCDVCKDSGAVKTGEFEYSNCPCVSDERHLETLEVKKLSPIERIGYLIEMYENERERLMVILKPYYQKQQYAEAKEYQDRMNHITEFIAQLKLIK